MRDCMVVFVGMSRSLRNRRPLVLALVICPPAEMRWRHQFAITVDERGNIFGTLSGGDGFAFATGNIRSFVEVVVNPHSDAKISLSENTVPNDVTGQAKNKSKISSHIRISPGDESFKLTNH